MNANKNNTYKKKGFVQAAVAALLLLVVGFAVATVTQNIGTSISVQSYTQVAPSIAAISDATIKQDVNSTISASFQAQRINAQNTPLMSQAVFLGVIIVILFGSISATMGGFGGMAGGGGGGRLSF